MMRVAAGTWVVVLVLCALLAGATLLGPGLPGEAARQPPPTPPPVGTCVLGEEDPTIVPCSSPHSGEIIASWTGNLPDLKLDPTMYPPDLLDIRAPETYCWALTDLYIGTVPGPPNPPLIYQSWSTPGWETSLLRGPAGTEVPEWTWSACVLSPHSLTTRDDVQLEPTLSSLRGVGTDPTIERPEFWRLCGGQSLVWVDVIPCTEPHRSEQVGSLGFELTPQEAERLLAQHHNLDGLALKQATQGRHVDLPVAAQTCQAMATTYLGADLATHAGQLDTVLGFQAFGMGTLEDPESSDLTTIYVACDLVVVGDRQLVGSVAGIGSAPLPFAP